MSDKSKVRPPFLHTDNPPPAPVAPEQKLDNWPKQQLGGFDWKSAASLRAPEKPGEKAERAWDTTEWEDPAAPPVSDEARRVAEQIDSVVSKIRKGELSIDGKAPTPETAMAAALEALIRAK